MKAYVLEAVNSLTYKDVEIPSLEEGWVLVKVKASGICSSDIPRIYKKGTYHFPTIPGHEFSGIVEKAGSIIEEKWIGKKVAVFPLIPCRACHACMEGNYEMCENYNYIGKVASEIRKQNISVNVCYIEKGFKQKMKYANKLQTKYAIIIGEDEVNQNKIVLKNMIDGSQTDISINELSNIDKYFQ